MTATFVSRPASGINGFTSATSITPKSDFTGGLTNGKLYIAWTSVHVASQTINFTGTGWTLGDRNSGAYSSCWAWMVYSGTQAAAPTFSWSSAGVVHAGNTSWQGQDPSPIGNTTKAAGTGTSITIGTVAVTKYGGAFLSLAFTGASNLPPTPTNYTNVDSIADGFSSEKVSWEALTCDSATVTISSANWTAFLIEIQGSGQRRTLNMPMLGW